MTEGRPTEGLIRELVRGLRPVRTIPRLRVVAAGVVGLWLVGAALHWSFGAAPFVGKGSYWDDPLFLGVLCGLALTAFGSVVAALAGAVPGRDPLARRGRQLALAGVGLAVGAGLYALLPAATGASATPLGQQLGCTGRAAAIGIVPAIFACAFLARASARRPLVAAAIASVGTFALGAIAVHASCRAGGAEHWLVSHSLAPLLLSVLIAFPLATLITRTRGRA